MDAETKADLHKRLLEYGRMDTLALAAVHRALVRVAATPAPRDA